MQTLYKVNSYFFNILNPFPNRNYNSGQQMAELKLLSVWNYVELKAHAYTIWKIYIEKS